MPSEDNIGVEMTVHYESETDTASMRISHLEPSHLRRLIAVVMKRERNFRCTLMSGGKWSLYVGLDVLSAGDVAKVTGSVVGGKL